MRNVPAIRRPAVVAGAVMAGLLAGCSASPAPSTSAASTASVINVSASACGTGWSHPTAGTQILQVHNATRTVVEIELINPVSGVIYAQVEGIGPGTTRSMPVDVGSGQYAFACSGQDYGNRAGPVIKVPGTVHGGTGIAQLTTDQQNSITMGSRTYVAGGLAMLLPQTAALAADIQAGNLAAARTDWLTAHLTWERLGSAYGMFASYDDAIDGLPFGLTGGVHNPGFTGFYRLEYGLWHDQSAAKLTGPARDLVNQTRALQVAWPGIELPTTQAVGDLALRTHEVLEDAMQNQLSGLDDFGSGTTLATFAAALDAARAQLNILRPYLAGRYSQTAALYQSLDQLQRLIDAEKHGSDWTPASQLSSTQRERLNAAAGQTVELLAPLPVIFEQERPIP